MAAPAYSNDLTTIATGDLNYDTGTWDESSDGGWDTAGSMVDDLNLWYTENMINTGEAANSCTSAQYTKDGDGSGASGPGTIMYVHTAAFTVPTDGAVVIHSLWAAPTSLNIYGGTPGTAEAGVSVLVGDDLGVFDVHYVSGSDRAPAPEGGWATYAVDPTITPDTSVGTPTTTTMVGIAIAATAQARGNPNAVQAIRYGRCEQEYTIGDATTPATFEGYAIVDNTAADRFNLLKYTEDGYKARGLMTFGTAATAVYFEDSDKAIVIADDPKVGTNFNQGIVNHASSVLNWTNISIKNISAVAKYKFTVNDSATTNHTGCVFTNLGTFLYGSNSTQVGVTFRTQELVSQLGSTFTSCTFDKPIGVSGLLVSNLNSVTKCTFNSDGSNYGADLGTVNTVSYNWDNYESDHVTGSTGTDVGVAPTGNETILVSVNNGEVLTINVQTGASVPSIANAGTGTVDVVAGQVTTTITVRDKDTKAIIQNAMVYIYADTGGGLTEGTVIINKVLTDVNGQVSDTRSLSSDQPILGRARYASISPFYKTEPVGATISSSTGLTLTLYMISDE